MSTAYMEVSNSNSYVFSSVRQGDLVIRLSGNEAGVHAGYTAPESNALLSVTKQVFRLGGNNSNVSVSNNILQASNINFTGSLTQNGVPFVSGGGGSVAGISNLSYATSNLMSFHVGSNTSNDGFKWLTGSASNEVLKLTGDGKLMMSSSTYSFVDYGVSNLNMPSYVTGTVALDTSSPFGSTYTDGSFAFNGNYSNNICLSNSMYSFNWWQNGGFTLEAWVNYATFSNAALGNPPASYPALAGVMQAFNSPDYWSFGADTGGTLRFQYFNGTGKWVNATTTLTTNTWYHVAVSYDMSNIRIFQNGTLVSTPTAVVGTPMVAFPFTIGNVGTAYPTVKISNLRYVKGAGLYTANFTPSTSPLTVAPSGTTMLLLRVPKQESQILNLSSQQLAFGKSILPATTLTYDLGSSDNRWRDLYLSGSSLNLGGVKLTSDSTNNFMVADSNNNLKKIMVSELQMGTNSNTSVYVDQAGQMTFKAAGSNVMTMCNTMISLNTNFQVAAPLNLQGLQINRRGGNALNVSLQPQFISNGCNIYINSGSNFGIGTSLPTQALDVIGNIATGSVVRLTSGGVLQNVTADATVITTGTVAIARLPAASTSASGIVQLTDSVSSTSTITAATPNSVKVVYDIASRIKAFGFVGSNGVGTGLNLSNVTYNGVGTYTVWYSNNIAFPYGLLITAERQSSGNWRTYQILAKTSSNLQVYTYNPDNSIEASANWSFQVLQ